MSRLLRITRELLTSPPERSVRRFSEKIKSTTYHVRGRRRRSGLTDAELLAAFNGRFSGTAELSAYWQARPPRSFPLHPAGRDETVRALVTRFPNAEMRILAAAERVCEHRFDLLGSAHVSTGSAIDWHGDFSSEHRFDEQAYCTDILPAPYPGGYEIKIPWELSRCQHFSWLGQAYWLSGDERYALEFTAQVMDWIEHNPAGWGVNWTSPMDVAIRAVNWLWGYAFFESSAAVDHTFLCAFLKSLLAHGRHIHANLEKMAGGSSNHYLADLTGLAYLGCLIPEFEEARGWRELAFSEFENEMLRQVLEDGVDYEASTSYHRLVTEFFIHATLLAQAYGWTFSQAYMDRLERMLDFVLYLARPDGSVPLIGDHDNGRLVRLRIWDEEERGREWCDFRYLLGLGALIFERSDFAAACGDAWEEALWTCGDQAAADPDPPPEGEGPGSRLFTPGRIAVLRTTDLHMVFDAGGCGLNGLGAHAHNDTLSFELFAGGTAWLIDPGTGTYTRDYTVRHTLRSARSHNALMVDAREPNAIDVRDPFRLVETSPGRIEKWISSDAFDLLVAGMPLPSGGPGYHRRVIYFHKAERYWILRDVLEGSGKHLVEWFFQCGKHTLHTSGGSDRGVELTSGEETFSILPLAPHDGLTLAIEEGILSLSYGAWESSTRIVYRLEGTFPLECRFFLAPAAADAPDEDNQARAVRAWQNFGLSGMIS